MQGYRNKSFLPLFDVVRKPIYHRVDEAFATETVDSGSIIGRVKPKIIKMLSCFTFSNKKKQWDTFTDM